MREQTLKYLALQALSDNRTIGHYWPAHFGVLREPDF
jgi:hypothetical protein